jgi:hypothetical protein
MKTSKANCRSVQTHNNAVVVATYNAIQFPLEEGATVCGYAVDIDGAMVPGVIVGKEKARAVFEEEVREHKSAPAIAEQVAGNMFQTRIHPFRAKVPREKKENRRQELIDFLF